MSTEEQSAAIGWVRFSTPTDDWYYLEREERQRYLAAFDEAVQRAIRRGAILLGTYKCRGQSRWTRFEFWEFPDLTVLLDFSEDLEEIGHFQYFAEDKTFGRRYERTGDAESWVL